MISILINVDWLLLIVPTVFIGGCVTGWRWTGRKHGRGEHSYYEPEVSVSRVGGNDPQLTVAQCQKRAEPPSAPTTPLVLARRLALRTPTGRPRLTA